MSATGWTLLTPTQARVLAVLVEKRHTVPDTYPMSLLALTAGCNQRTSRDPVMDLSEAQVQEAIDVLRPRSLVIESSGGRVMRYSENAGRVLGLPRESVALPTFSDGPVLGSVRAIALDTSLLLVAITLPARSNTATTAPLGRLEARIM